MADDILEDGKRKRFGRSFEVLELIKNLSILKQGESIKYSTLTEIIMGDCSPGGVKYPYLLSARRILTNENKMLFRAVPNEGLERLDDPGIVNRSDKKLAAATRAAEKEMRILTFVDFEKLSPEHQLTHNTNMSVFNVLKTVGATDKVKKIRNEIGNLGNRLEIAETIKAFSGK